MIGELAYWLGHRLSVQQEAAFLRRVAGDALPVVEPLSSDWARAADVVEEYGDWPLGTVDAVIVAMAERLGVTTIFTLDRRHFGAVRPAHREQFEIVP